MKAARIHVAEIMREAFPAWRVIDNYERPDVLDRLTLLVSVTEIARERSAPIGAYDSTVTLTLVSPIAVNHPAAAAELEDALPDLLDAIETHLGSAWEPAKFGAYNDTYIAWEVPVHVILTREEG